MQAVTDDGPLGRSTPDDLASRSDVLTPFSRLLAPVLSFSEVLQSLHAILLIKR